jgi:hypothetical protein
MISFTNLTDSIKSWKIFYIQNGKELFKTNLKILLIFSIIYPTRELCLCFWCCCFALAYHYHWTPYPFEKQLRLFYIPDSSMIVVFLYPCIITYLFWQLEAVYRRSISRRLFDCTICGVFTVVLIVQFFCVFFFFLFLLFFLAFPSFGHLITTPTSISTSFLFSFSFQSIPPLSLSSCGFSPSLFV